MFANKNAEGKTESLHSRVYRTIIEIANELITDYRELPRS